VALNLNQFGSILGGAAKGATRGVFGGPAGIAAGGMLGAATSKGAQPAIKNAANIAGGAAKGAAKGAIAGPAGIAAGGMLGAATSKSGQKVLGGAAKGAAKGAIAGPVGIGIGGAIGAIGGLFGGNKATAKPKTVKPSGPAQYTVKKGDTLTSIAANNKTTVAELRKANPQMTAPGSKYKNGNMIWSGTKVNMAGSNTTMQDSMGKGKPKKAAPVPNKAGGGIASKTLPAIGQAAGGAAGAPVVNGLKSISGKMGIL
jgi:LysM repeat protein